MSFLLSVIRGEPEGRGNILTLLRILTLLFTSYSIKAQTSGIPLVAFLCPITVNQWLSLTDLNTTYTEGLLALGF